LALRLTQDDAIHITLPPDAPSSPEPLAVAKLLQAILKREGKTKYDLVLMGKQSIDSDASQTGQILAGLMGWSQGTFASAVDLGEDG
jgi:electron transfer flavoprotein beta subunit